MAEAHVKSDKYILLLLFLNNTYGFTWWIYYNLGWIQMLVRTFYAELDRFGFIVGVINILLKVRFSER